MTPPLMTARELRARIKELRFDARGLTFAIMREHDPRELRTLSRQWHAVTRGEVTLLDELARRGEVAP